MTTEKTGKIVKLDLRTIPVFHRHPTIFNEWDRLGEGDTLQLINDHDPKPLYYQFDAEHKGSFGWEYLSKGPEDWVVNIKKTKAAAAPVSGDLRARVNEALDAVRPGLNMDGGDVELVDIDEGAGTVTVHLMGACGGCPSAGLTLKAGIEEAIKEYAPEIKEVQAV